MSGRKSWFVPFRSISESVEPGGEELSYVGAIPADHGDGIAAVVLAQECAAEAETEGLVDRRSIVDQTELHGYREGHHLAGRRSLVPRVVLHVPEVGVRQHLVEHVPQGLDRAVQADENCRGPGSGRRPRARPPRGT